MLPIIAPNSTAHNAAFSQVYPDPQSHAFAPSFCHSVSLETPTGEMENASALEQPLNPRTGHSSVCYRFKVLQGEQGSLWTSNGSLIPHLRSHTIPSCIPSPCLKCNFQHLCVCISITVHGGMLFKHVPSDQRLASRYRCAIQAQPKIS